jgi:thioredoxin reductase
VTVWERIFYEVHPLVNSAGKTFVILGAGDAAFDYALNLAKKNRVIILNKGFDKKCLPLLWERAQGNPAIEYCACISLERIEAGKSAGLVVVYSCAGESRVCECEALLVAFGREPQLRLLINRLREISRALEAQGKLYLIGDVKNGIYRQTSIAVGDGILAAMKIYQRRNAR